jgi:hypothetical protein
VELSYGRFWPIAAACDHLQINSRLNLSAEPEEQKQAVPKPNLDDYVSAKAEQGCLFLGITALTVVSALIVFSLGALTGTRGFDVAAAVILFVGLAVGIFVGCDVNYRVARMRARAEERTQRASDR